MNLEIGHKKVDSPIENDRERSRAMFNYQRVAMGVNSVQGSFSMESKTYNVHSCLTQIYRESICVNNVQKTERPLGDWYVATMGCG